MKPHMNKFLQLWQRWRLRRAQEKHAMWKGRHEEWQRQLQADPYFANNPYNRHKTIQAAGKAALYNERIEQLMRQ